MEGVSPPLPPSSLQSSCLVIYNDPTRKSQANASTIPLNLQTHKQNKPVIKCPALYPNPSISHFPKESGFFSSDGAPEHHIVGVRCACVTSFQDNLISRPSHLEGYVIHTWLSTCVYTYIHRYLRRAVFYVKLKMNSYWYSNSNPLHRIIPLSCLIITLCLVICARYDVKPFTIIT